MKKVNHGRLITTIGANPVRLEQAIGKVLAIIDYDIAQIAEGERLHAHIAHETASAEARPEWWEEHDVDHWKAQDNADQ